MAEYRVHHVRFFEYQPKAIHCIAYEKETDRIAVSRSDGSVEIWSIQDNWLQEKVIVGSEEQSIEAVVWVQQRLFTAGLSGDVIEYDLCKLQPKTFVSSNAGAVWCLTKNSSNTKLAAGTEFGCIVLFDLTGGLLTYERAFDKQEGRILSLSWHINEEIIVTGGVDNIRVWSVNSGHAIQRLTLGRGEKHKETIVWSVIITSDMTIISGDSRGKTSFWNGKQGTLIRSYQSHKADVLCLAVNEAENSVFSSGVDPSLAQFEYIATKPNSDWKTWVRSSSRSQHSHDVRSLAYTGDYIVSGGVDTVLIFNNIERNSPMKFWRRIPAIPHESLVGMATEAGLVVLNYSTYLEVWRLGSTTATSDKHGDILPLRENPIKLLQLKTKNCERVVCFAVSLDGMWLAYSDQENLRLYRLSMDTYESVSPNISVDRVKLTSPMNSAVHKIVFTPDSRRCVVATCEGMVNVLDISSDSPSLYHSFTFNSDMISPVHILCISPDSKLIAVHHHGNPIQIFDIKRKECLCQLPQYPCQPTALSFAPASDNLIIAYSDQMILEYSVREQEYSTWCRQNMKKFPRQWLKRHSKICRISFSPRSPKQIILHDEQMMCILDKSQPFPGKEVNLYSTTSWQKQSESSTPVQHAFHICSKYKFLLHLEAMEADWLLVVERPPITILDALPPTLKQKKFGT